MKDDNSLADVSNHYIIRLASIRLKDFFNSTYFKMRRVGLRDKFREESQKCFRAVIAFYDLAMKSPRAAQIALEKLKTGELLREQSPDELKLALIEITKIARESEITYQDCGPEFAFKVTRLSCELLSLAREAIEQKLQQEKSPLKGILKQQEEVGGERDATTDRRSVSWAEHVTMR